MSLPHPKRDATKMGARTRRRVGKAWIAATLALAVLLVVVPAATATSQTTFTITGHGWGHGIGMSQWGAYGMAKNGSTYKQILKHYYTGIGFMEIGNPTLAVRLRSGLTSAKVTCVNDFTVRDAKAGPFTIPAGTTATTTYVDGKYRVVAGSLRKNFAGAVTFTPKSGALNILTATDTGQTGRFRGKIKILRVSGALMMINLVRMESYLRGVVPHEVSPSWPAESLKAQACAARSYAERARRASSNAWDLYTDVRSQVYSGMAREDSRSNAAVVATKGIVPSYGGAPIQAFYFSSSGGRTENIELAWQTTALPYLKSVDDPYDTYATLHNWGPTRKTGAALTRSLGTAVKGSLVAIYRVKRGVSPRIVKAAIIGTSGTTYMHGSTLRTKLALNSAWATFKSMSVVPAARDNVTVTKGETIAISGVVYPALPSGTQVKLMYNADGTWRSLAVNTARKSRTLTDGYTAAYSSYRISLTPGQTTKYYWVSGTAKSPTTTITVTE